MSAKAYNSGPTSNDLLERLMVKHPPADRNYEIIAQSAQDVQNINNAPAVSMGPYLIQSDQVRLLKEISIYSLPGESRGQLRLFYMNASAIRVWKEMGRAPKIIGAQHRPPRTALLAYGVPFSS